MVAEALLCDLCGLPSRHPLTDEEGHAFCCPACLEVSTLLREDVADSPAPATAAEMGETETAVFSLGGMWCPSCAWLIGERLRRTPGVATADVSFLQREARIAFDAHAVNPARLQRRIRQTGYRAWHPGEKAPDEEEAHWNRLLISGVLTMHIMVLSFMLYFREWTGRASAETAWLENIFELMILVMSVPVILVIGLPILRAGAAGLLHGRPNTHTLIAIGSFAAFALSLRNFIAGSGGIYFDTAAVLLFLIAIGRWLEMRAQKVSKQAVERLWERVPAQATQITADGDVMVAADAVLPGAKIRVRPGERFPVDGLIALGEGDIDESLLTGEPEAVTRSPGDTVYAGTVNLDGAFEVVTTAVGAESAVGQIGRLLHQALWQRAPVERLADKVAAWMVPTAVLLAAGTFLFWSNRLGVEAGLMNALSVLLIACPCALGIATPLTLWLGVGKATEAGVILRQTEVLVQLAQVRQVFFDKTGTLTQRPLRLQTVYANGLPQETFIEWVAAVEAQSEHPVAQAIANDAGRFTTTLLPPPVQHFRALPGQGVMAQLDDTPIWVGSRRLMEANELIASLAIAEAVTAWQADGLTVVYAGWNGRVQGILGLGERLRPETAVAMAALQEMNMCVAVLTGDDAAAGRRWQAALGVPVIAALSPEQKVAQLQTSGAGTLMVGDGLNDGPALAAATVGIAVSQGTDVAQAAANAVLLNNDLQVIPWLLRLARMTMKKVRQNLIWAFVYNVLGLALAVTGTLQPAIAALFMVFSNLIVTGNALRLRRVETGAPGGNRCMARIVTNK